MPRADAALRAGSSVAADLAGLASITSGRRELRRGRLPSLRRPRRDLEVRLAASASEVAARAGAPLRRLLRGDVGRGGRARTRHYAPRRGPLRPRSATICSCSTIAKPHAAPRQRAGDRRHLSAAPPGGRRPARRLLHGHESIDLAPLLSGKPHLSFLELGRSCVLAALSQQAHARAALARHLGLCADARRRRDDRLRQPGRHRSRPARSAAVASSTIMHARRRNGRSARRGDLRVEMNRMPLARDRCRARRSGRCRR